MDPERTASQNEFDAGGGLPADFPLDLMVRTPEFIARRLQWGDWFIQEILAKGGVLYETTDPSVWTRKLSIV
jgi:hypothetical protein